MTLYFLDTLARFLKQTIIALVLLLAGFSLQTSVAQEASASNSANTSRAVVGEVSLVLGKAFKQAPGERRISIQVGSEIRVNDRIFTEANGHVHIRFVDKALVSVRPRSQLDIVRYDFDSENPAQSSVKFSLEEGVTRAISGEAARSARQRFRLNTPIAAIGVRGTDFVVSASQRTTRALVNEGTIVMAPYSSECSAADFGPCSANALELTDNSLQLIELDGIAASPRLVPAPHERNPGGMRDEVELAIASVETEGATLSERNDVYLESVATTTVVSNEAKLISGATDPVNNLPAEPDLTPTVAISSAALKERQLVWGRWTESNAAQERITLSYADAREDRKVTVGNEDYVLFRTENDGTRVDRGLGVVSFALDSAQAFYSSDSGIVAMRVSGGSLDIDFPNSLFATELNLGHALTGNIDIIANGKISEGGYFNSRTADQVVAGAVNTAGTEAGYFFERQLQDGGIQGLTLWDKR